MKQKYILSRDADNSLIVKEYAELETGIFSLLCEENFTSETVEAAMEAGKEFLVNALRTHNMYPPAGFAEPIADAVIALFKEGEDRRELLFDDMDFISREQDVAATYESDEDSADLIDDLLEEEIEEDAYTEDGLDGLDEKDKKGSIKLADDDGGVDIDI
ncbi:hypothetical protein LZ24_02477 [Desulfobotulus alkaliphilus]|uniref:Uncharacterized protein n=1 Tax=Desulfobotulus alkaliphilus TaxID=622671 RepID=A0A562RHE1_9BACT|nr:hypothetical protein [Desulfobotulus alkaliphilus]TWI68507.1 hypothetical protein LZ24_02477 [Desulfobotulus alkaliphilus]